MLKPTLFHGMMTDLEKMQAKDAFLSGHATLSPLLITAQTGGCGLNLQAASVVLQVELWWNPTRRDKVGLAVTDRGNRQVYIATL
jgi:hypothetical protein